VGSRLVASQPPDADAGAVAGLMGPALEDVQPPTGAFPAESAAQAPLLPQQAALSPYALQSVAQLEPKIQV
jgi:hypothetical protein